MSKFAVLGFVGAFLAVLPLTLVWSACCTTMLGLSPSAIGHGWRATIAVVNIGIALAAGVLVAMTAP